MDYYKRYQMYLDALRQPIIKLAKLEFLYPDGSVNFVLDNNKQSSCFIQNGNLTVNQNNGIRRMAEISLVNEDGKFDYEVNKLWFNQQVRLSMGLLLADNSEYYIPQGVFYIKDPEEIFEPGNQIINLQLVDKWAHLDGSLFGYLEGIYEVPLNSNIFTAIQSILELDRGNGMIIDNVPPLFTDYYNEKTVTLPDNTVLPILNTPYTARIDSTTGTYADVILEMNTMLAGLIGYNANGQLQLEPSQDDVLDTDKPILWNFQLDEPEFLGATYQISNAEIYNDIIVTGAEIEGKTARARVTNRDIRSPYNVQTIGLKTKPRQDTTSEQYVSDEQCADLGKYWLKQDTVKKMNISISSSQMFHLYENGLITLYRPDRQDALQRHLITGYTLPIGLGRMTINATSVNDYINLDTTIEGGNIYA